MTSLVNNKLELDNAIFGYTGLVGSNLIKFYKHKYIFHTQL